MSVDRVDGSGIPQRPDAVGSSQDAQRDRPATSAEDRDRIDLSADVQRVGALAEAAGRLPEIRQERVAALQRDVAAGTYQVDPQQVARAILEFEDALGR